MESHDIKLIKYGVLFFYEHATLKYDSSMIEIIKADGTVAFAYPLNSIKNIGFNGKSGIFTIKAHTGQKVNIAFKSETFFERSSETNALCEFIKTHNLKGFTI